MLKIGMQSQRRLGGGAGKFFNHLKDTIKKKRYANIVWSSNPFQDIGWYSSVARGLAMFPFVLRLDGIYWDKRETHGSNKKLNEKIFSSIDRASGIIFQSEFGKKVVESHYGYCEVPQTVILNGAPLAAKSVSDFLEARRGREKKTIVCSARWRPHKRLKAMIEAVRRLRRHIDCELIVLGEVEDLPESDGFIKFIGSVSPEGLFYYLDKADIFLHLSWLDTCPNSVVEAISHRLPVVCSNRGGTAEIVRATNGGCVAECDEDIDFSGLVDLYDPPMPDLDEVVLSIESVLMNYERVVQNIDLSPIDIELTARRYVGFSKEVLEWRGCRLQGR